MRYWVRELAGWVLVGVGLLVFYACYDFLVNRQVVEAGGLTVIGIFLFRGGIHLLKMAVAARVCLEAQERMARERLRAAEGLPPSRPAARFPQVRGGVGNRGTRTA
jgi:hypothetical protein